MNDPATAEAFNEKFNKNVRYEGFGMFEVAFRMPCPGCAEPDWLVYRVIETEEAMQKGATCKHCGRGFRAIYQKHGHTTSFRVVQYCGPDLPAYQPHIERV